MSVSSALAQARPRRKCRARAATARAQSRAEVEGGSGRGSFLSLCVRDIIVACTLLLVLVKERAQTRHVLLDLTLDVVVRVLGRHHLLLGCGARGGGGASRLPAAATGGRRQTASQRCALMRRRWWARGTMAGLLRILLHFSWARLSPVSALSCALG